MKKKNAGETRFEFNPNNPTAMSEPRMARLKAMEDGDIDFSDTPAQAGLPERRIFGPRFGSPKDVIALEPDVLLFFKEDGGVSSARVNAALREYAETHRKTA